MLSKNLELSPAMRELALEKCPQAVQVMPPAVQEPHRSLFWSICGNVLAGSILLATLLLLPALMAGLFSLAG